MEFVSIVISVEAGLGYTVTEAKAVSPVYKVQQLVFLRYTAASGNVFVTRQLYFPGNLAT